MMPQFNNLSTFMNLYGFLIYKTILDNNTYFEEFQSKLKWPFVIEQILCAQ